MLTRILQRLLRKRVSQLTVIDADGSNRTVLYQTREWIEAPNWTPDGQWLIFNGSGKLYRLRATGEGTPEHIATGTIDQITNDHLVSPNGQRVYFTASGRLYGVPLSGGQPEQVSPAQAPTNEVQYYLHGISPDGQRLSCVGVNTAKNTAQPLALYVVDINTRTATQVTHTQQAVDGAEFSPDGRWIYFNGELHAKRPGHSQLYRMRTDGPDIEQLTHDERVNWFPHVSPDGSQLVYLSYEPGTVGHPANCPVLLRRMPTTGGNASDVVALTGGQGTLNGNSWSPDSKRLAYVAYPQR